MLTSKPRKKKRGRQPPAYGPRICPLCATKLKMNHVGLYCPNIPACNWKE
jgi:NAD-dependent DNA ligase